jgi:hypothetical protein
MDGLKYNLVCLFWATVAVSPILWILLFCL